MTSVALPSAGSRTRSRRWPGAAIALGLSPASSRCRRSPHARGSPSLVLAIAALAVGIFVVTRGEERFGLVRDRCTAVLGFALAYLATRSGIGKLETVVVWSALFASMLRFATPLIFARASAACSRERSGVVNIGLEGMMLMGAFFGIMAADKLDSWVLGLLVGILVGRRDGAPPRDLVDPLPRGPDHQRLRDQLPRARAHGLPVHRHLRAGGHADRHPEHPATCACRSSTTSRSSATSSGTSTS